MCQNTTMRVYGAWIKRYRVLCSKYIAARTSLVITSCWFAAWGCLHLWDGSMYAVRLLTTRGKVIVKKVCSVSSSTKKALKKAHWQQVNLILDTAEKEHNTKPFWNYIKSQRQDTVGASPLKKKTKASILQDQFTSVFTTDNTDPNHDLKTDGQRYQSTPPLLVRNEGILKLLQHINPSKSSGPSEVAGRPLEELGNE